MATEYSVSRKIAAEPQKVWSLLTDSGTYEEWNTAVVSIEGDISEGSRIALTSIVNPDREFKLNVSDVNAPKHMVWSDGMPLGLFKGVRTFDVEDNGDGTSQFTMREVYSGLMAPLITKSIPDQTDAFEQFADGLKAAAESR